MDPKTIPVLLDDIKQMVSTLEEAYVFDDDKAKVLRILKKHLPVGNDTSDDSYNKERFIAP